MQWLRTSNDKVAMEAIVQAQAVGASNENYDTQDIESIQHSIPCLIDGTKQVERGTVDSRDVAASSHGRGAGTPYKRACDRTDYAYLHNIHSCAHNNHAPNAPLSTSDKLVALVAVAVAVVAPGTAPGSSSAGNAL